MARLRLNNWPNSFMVIFAGIVALNKLAQLFQVSIYVHPLQQTKGNSCLNMPKYCIEKATKQAKSKLIYFWNSIDAKTSVNFLNR